MLIAIGEMFTDADFKKWIFLFPLHHPHASGENNNKSNGSNNKTSRTQRLLSTVRKYSSFLSELSEHCSHREALYSKLEHW